MLHAELRVYQQIVEDPGDKEDDDSEGEVDEQQAGDDDGSGMTGEGGQVMDALAENGGCLLGACDCNELCETVAFGRPRLLWLELPSRPWVQGQGLGVRERKRKQKQQKTTLSGPG